MTTDLNEDAVTMTAWLKTEAHSYQRQMKQFIHRSRFMSTLLDAVRTYRRDRHFSSHLRHSIGAATQWERPEAVREVAFRQVQRLMLAAEPFQKKGYPPLSRIRASEVAVLEDALRPADGGSLGPAELAAAARVASLDPSDSGAFSLYLAVFWLINQHVIRALRGSTTAWVVVHLTCWPRLPRAEQCIASFDVARHSDLSHVKLVGTDGHYTFQANERVLGVPSGDGYESLPPKVFQALAILTLATHPSGVLKLDDDHRLLDAQALRQLMRSAATASDAVQYGQVNRMQLPSSHHRAWHFGKCRDAAVGSRVLEMPAPQQWATGSAGYILNRPALWRVLWGSLYYSRWLNEILYEDLALAELATKTGIRVVSTPMERAITAVGEY
jgi:hypothetical protein